MDEGQEEGLEGAIGGAIGGKEEDDSRNEEAEDGDNSDFESRRLCPDGSCVGLLDAGGRCRACGVRWEGQSETAGSGTDAASDSGNWNPDDEHESSIPTTRDEEGDGSIPGEWEARRLCSDGACIGVLGPDGRCRECGKLG
ncbi:MAG: hypothetical protein V2A73_12035 [Pseudomonadota bacterium]